MRRPRVGATTQRAPQARWRSARTRRSRDPRRMRRGDDVVRARVAAMYAVRTSAPQSHPAHCVPVRACTARATSRGHKRSRAGRAQSAASASRALRARPRPKTQGRARRGARARVLLRLRVRACASDARAARADAPGAMRALYVRTVRTYSGPMYARSACSAMMRAYGRSRRCAGAGYERSGGAMC